MEITLYTENGAAKAHFYSEISERFLSLIIKKTKQIKLKSGEDAFEYIEEDLLWYGIETALTVIIRKGDFFVIK